MKIFSNLSVVLLDIDVDDNSFRYRSIMGDHKVVLHFSMAESIEIPVGSYIQYQGQTYTLLRPENFKKNGTRKFEYEITFGSNQELLKQFKFKFLSTTPYKLKFPLTAKPKMFLDLLTQNLNLNDSGWSVGACIDASEKVISFNHDDCFGVLNRLADEFDTEWEIVGKTIHLRKTEHNKDNPLPLSYGKGNGFQIGVGRAMQGDVRPVTMLYVQGGDRNINRETYYSTDYKSETLLLPMGQTLSYEGRTYKTDEHGMYITRADKPLTVVSEDSYDGSTFYPSRVGEVSAVDTKQGTDNEGKPVTFYDIIDSSIPDDLDFSKCTIKGEKVTIIFQSGILTGKEFEVVADQEGNLTGYVHAERRFKLVPADMDGVMMPNESYCPLAGNKYAVFHISLPDAYICHNPAQSGASWEMFKEAVRYMYENEEERFSFTGELDGIWSKKNWLSIGGKLIPGSYILFSDPQFQPAGIPIRITGITDYINKPYSPTIELSNAPVAGYLSTELNRIKGEEVVNEERIVQLRNYTKRRYEDAKEAQTMLEKALDNFSPGVDPIWVRTMSVLVGNEYQQFEFVNNKTNSQTEVIPNFKMDNTTKIFTAPQSILKHMTMDIDNTSSTYDAGKYKYWDMGSYTSPYLGDDRESYYFVAKCAKSGTTGNFLLQKEYTYDPGDGYYYFLVGLLSSEKEGERSYASAYGYTEILPGQMRIKNIISPDGKTSFNVAEGIISGNIRIQSGSTGYNNLTDKPNLGEYVTNSVFNSEFQVLSNQISSKVSQTTFNALGTRVSSAESSIIQQANQISSKVSQTSFNDLGTRVYWAESTIIQQANQISSKVSQTDFNTLGTRVSSAESTIIQQAGLISQKVSTTTFNALGTRVSSAESSIIQQANQISSKVSTSTFNVLGTRVSSAESTIIQQTDQISSKVSQTDYNGNKISSLINQTTTTITISASKIDLNGKVSISMFNPTDKATIEGKANKNDLKSLAFQDVVNAAQLGSTIVSGGYLNTQLIKVRRIDADQGFIGGFQLSNNNLLWKQYNYFGVGSRTLRMGLAEDLGGALDIEFDASTSGAFGIKTVGRANGGAAIFASSKPTASIIYPKSGYTYAGYFDGALCARSFHVDNGTDYYTGIDFDNNVDLDKHRFTVRKGLIVGLYKE